MVKEPFFPLETLPSEIIFYIFSRIQIKTLFTCKCVCKTWLARLKSREFVRFHLSKSAPKLLIHNSVVKKEPRPKNHPSRWLPQPHTDAFKIFEYEEDSSLGISYKEVLDHQCEDMFVCSCWQINGCKWPARIASSVDGLLFLRSKKPHPNAYFICNPIAREYTKLPMPVIPDRDLDWVVPCGFGVSRLSNQYKVVRIFDKVVEYPEQKWLVRHSFAHVYALGAESWASSTTRCDLLVCFTDGSIATFLDGSLHWLTKDLTGSRGISCFDLETELFTHFEAPIVDSRREGFGVYELRMGVVRGRLCLCETSELEVVVYLMSDYGNGEKYWKREYVVCSSPFPFRIDWSSADDGGVFVYVVKALENGDLLLAWENKYLFRYSIRDEAIARVENVDCVGKFEAVSYTPSLVSLKDLEPNNVELF